MIPRFLPLLLLALALPLRAHAIGEIEFREALRDFGSDLRLMCIAAHPDDEDGATLAWHRIRHGVETHVVIATRGEGGQNEIGPELYRELGVIRTREMQAAAAIEGARLHFLDLPEFGFSKTLEEAQTVWGAEETLRRVVRVIRQVQPHVIITHHGRMQDHGQHQAIGAAAIEAFKAAADPTRFPGQLDEGLRPWQTWRLYIRNWNGGPGSAVIDLGTIDPLRGTTYAEIAAEALRVHRSQGMETFIDRLLAGHPRAYYDLAESAPVPEAWKDMLMDAAAGPLFDGVPHLPAPQRAQLAASNAPRADLKRELLIETSRSAQTRTSSTDGERAWRDANTAAALACELRFRAGPERALYAPGERVRIHTVFEDAGEQDISNLNVSLRFNHGFTVSGLQPKPLAFDPDRRAETTFEFDLPPNAAPTLPHAEFLFRPNFLAPQVDVVAEAVATNAAVELRAPIYLDIAPPMAVEFLGAPYLAHTPGPIACRIALRNAGPQTRNETLALTAPPGWTIRPVTQTATVPPGAETIVTATLEAPPGTPEGRYPIGAFNPALGRPAEAEVSVAAVAVPPGLHIGLVESYDTTLAGALERLGVSFTRLQRPGFAAETLDACSAILVDMRAYKVRQDLRDNNNALLDYAKRGGTLIVFYQKTFEWSAEFAPYPLRIAMNRVTREDAPVELLQPDHRLFNTPNPIKPEDWNGWVQERGLYFAGEWDPAYVPLIACNDPGETIPPGALLAAQHGDGLYLYTGLCLYRQLRAQHPGALRLFVNLIAL